MFERSEFGAVPWFIEAQGTGAQHRLAAGGAFFGYFSFRAKRKVTSHRRRGNGPPQPTLTPGDQPDRQHRQRQAGAVPPGGRLAEGEHAHQRAQHHHADVHAGEHGGRVVRHRLVGVHIEEDVAAIEQAQQRTCAEVAPGQPAAATGVPPQLQRQHQHEGHAEAGQHRRHRGRAGQRHLLEQHVHHREAGPYRQQPAPATGRGRHRRSARAQADGYHRQQAQAEPGQLPRCGSLAEEQEGGGQ